MQSVKACSLLSSSGESICMTLHPSAGRFCAYYLFCKFPIINNHPSQQTPPILNSYNGFQLLIYVMVDCRCRANSYLIKQQCRNSQIILKNQSLYRYFQFMFQQIASAHRHTKNKLNEYCYEHPYRTAKYHNQEKTMYFCTACAIQQASRGIPVTQIIKNEAQHFQSPSLSLLQEVYQQSQNDIQQAIRRYNTKYQKLLQAMTDMQIRDLIDFNRKLEENQSLFKQMKEQTKHDWNRANLTEIFASSLPEAIIDKIQRLTNEMMKQNTLKVSVMRSKPVSPAKFSRRASPQQLNKNKSQTIDIKLLESSNSQKEAKKEISHSFSKSQTQTCSDHSKTSTMQEVKKDELEDTPESVKDRVSQQGLKVTANMAVTMFEKIDICQSINMQEKQGKQSRGSICSVKSRHRYDSNLGECIN